MYSHFSQKDSVFPEENQKAENVSAKADVNLNAIKQKCSGDILRHHQSICRAGAEADRIQTDAGITTQKGKDVVAEEKAKV